MGHETCVKCVAVGHFLRGKEWAKATQWAKINTKKFLVLFYGVCWFVGLGVFVSLALSIS